MCLFVQFSWSTKICFSVGSLFWGFFLLLSLILDIWDSRSNYSSFKIWNSYHQRFACMIGKIYNDDILVFAEARNFFQILLSSETSCFGMTRDVDEISPSTKGVSRPFWNNLGYFEFLLHLKMIITSIMISPLTT